jgi:drug/metabolite transporter (DMT)-like permease
VLLAWSHRHVEAWLGSLITQCMPIVSSVAAWVLLDETLTPLTIAGGLIVLAATAAVLMRTRTQPTDDTFDVAPESPAPAG